MPLRPEASRSVQLVSELVWLALASVFENLTCQVLSVLVEGACGLVACRECFSYGACLLECFSVLSWRGCCGSWGHSRSLWAPRGFGVVCGPGCHQRLLPLCSCSLRPVVLVRSQGHLEGDNSV